MNVDEKVVRRQLARVTRKAESAHRERCSASQAVAMDAATLPKPHQTSDYCVAKATDPASAKLPAATHPKRMGAGGQAVAAKSSARAKPAANRANPADGMDTGSSTASTTDSSCCESTRSNQEDPFDAAVLDEEDSEILDSMMQAMQTGKVSPTLRGESSSKQCTRLTAAARSRKANFSVEEATGMAVVGRSHDGPPATIVLPAFSLLFREAPPSSCKPSAAGSAAEDEAMPVF